MSHQRNMLGAVASGRERKVEEGPDTRVWATLDGEVKAEALPPAASRGNVGSRSKAVGQVMGSGQESLEDPF